MKKMKIKRYYITVGLLAAYAIFMTLFFGLNLLKEGQAARFWITLGAEAIVIVLAFFALRRREILRNQRKKDLGDL